MHTYLIILKENLELNSEVLNYFAKMNFTIKDYYPRLDILKIETDKNLEEINLKFIKSFEKDNTKKYF